MLAAVITCSDRAAAGIYPDRSGPLLRESLNGLGFETREPRVVPDNLVMIRAAIREAVASGSRVVLTTGGTGVGPRDVTAEATLDLLACELPGIMEAVRRRGAEKNPRALLSRGLAGVVECAGTRAIIINAPGSEGGASDTIEVAGPLLRHLVEQLDGADH
jgi:molybdenum cofactor biosynthesis protein